MEFLHWKFLLIQTLNKFIPSNDKNYRVQTDQHHIKKMEKQKLKNHDAMFYIQMKWNIAERMSFDRTTQGLYST